MITPETPISAGQRALIADLGSRSEAGPNHPCGRGDNQPPTEAELRAMWGDR
jgi:hypothetical protein